MIFQRYVVKIKVHMSVKVVKCAFSFFLFWKIRISECIRTSLGHSQRYTKNTPQLVCFVIWCFMVRISRLSNSCSVASVTGNNVVSSFLSELLLAFSEKTTLSVLDRSAGSVICEKSSLHECGCCFSATLCLTVMSDLCCLVWTSVIQHFFLCFSVYKPLGQLFPSFPEMLSFPLQFPKLNTSSACVMRL